VGDKIRKLRAAGCEIGLHGIDAWNSPQAGRDEAQQVMETSGDSAIGVRMHWLFRDGEFQKRLEEAGFLYDSTAGFNEVVGYRSGTGQAFKPLNVDRLLELPLHIMDTALFYPSYLDLSAEAARRHVAGLLGNAERDGGAITVNWHDRSIAPERQWGSFYAELLSDLTARGAWFATASQAVSWFRLRRSATLEFDAGRRAWCVRANPDPALPGLRLRIYPPGRRDEGWELPEDYTDIQLDTPKGSERNRSVFAKDDHATGDYQRSGRYHQEYLPTPPC
jgi:hypothetical protein